MSKQGKGGAVINDTISVCHFIFLSVNTARPLCREELSKPLLIQGAASFINCLFAHLNSAKISFSKVFSFNNNKTCFCFLLEVFLFSVCFCQGFGDHQFPLATPECKFLICCQFLEGIYSLNKKTTVEAFGNFPYNSYFFLLITAILFVSSGLVL